MFLHDVTKEIQQCDLTGNNHSCQPLLEFICFNKYFILGKKSSYRSVRCDRIAFREKLMWQMTPHRHQLRFCEVGFSLF